jgi:hypothetical protein
MKWMGSLLLLTLLAAVAFADPPVSPQVQKQRQESKAKFDREVAEMKRKQDLKKQQRRTEQAQTAQKMRENADEHDAAMHPSRQLPPFDPAAAPSPAACLQSFIASARTATSMEQLLPFLPVDEAAALANWQKTYDPTVAASNRAWHRQQDPKISNDSLTYITNPPYVNALERHKRIADKILDVLSISVKGNEAVIEVSTLSSATYDGVEYPYGAAKIEMKGEANYWKLGAYNDSNVNYRNPPRGR